MIAELAFQDEADQLLAHLRRTSRYSRQEANVIRGQLLDLLRRYEESIRVFFPPTNVRSRIKTLAEFFDWLLLHGNTEQTANTSPSLAA